MLILVPRCLRHDRVSPSYSWLRSASVTDKEICDDDVGGNGGRDDGGGYLRHLFAPFRHRSFKRHEWGSSCSNCWRRRCFCSSPFCAAAAAVERRQAESRRRRVTSPMSASSSMRPSRAALIPQRGTKLSRHLSLQCLLPAPLPRCCRPPPSRGLHNASIFDRCGRCHYTSLLASRIAYPNVFIDWNVSQTSHIRVSLLLYSRSTKVSIDRSISVQSFLSAMIGWLSRGATRAATTYPSSKRNYTS